MSKVLHFFDPRPPKALIRPAPAPLRYDTDAPADSGWVELLDVALTPSGEFILTVQPHHGPVDHWQGQAEISDGEADALVLRIGQYHPMVFPASDRARVTDLFMKLANRIF